MCGLHAKINSYLDFRVYFACYPPESFKLICFTCIWSQFVDTSFHSSQNPQQSPCRISQFSKNRGVKLTTRRGLGLAKSTPNLEAIGSNARIEGVGRRETAPRPLSSFDTHARWQPITQSSRYMRSRWSYGKIEDCDMICNAAKKWLNHRKRHHIQMDVTKYLALLDQFLTQDIIGSCALNVMIDSEMSQKQKIDIICSIISTIGLSFPLAFINLIFDSALQTWLAYTRGEGWGEIPYRRLMGMCRWMGSHFHDWSEYNGVAFSIELLEWGRTFFDFWGKTVLHISS